MKSGRGSGRTMDVVNGMFAFSFFVTRNVVYTMGMGHLFWFSWEEVKALPSVSGVPVGWYGLTLGCMILGWGLNGVWGVKILKMVLGGGGGGKKEKKKKQ